MYVWRKTESGYLHLQAQYEDVGHWLHGQDGRVEHALRDLVPQAEAERDDRHGDDESRRQGGLGGGLESHSLEASAQKSRYVRPCVCSAHTHTRCIFTVFMCFWNVLCFFFSTELRMAEMAEMGIGNKPCLDIRPSQDQINDRSISYAQLAKGNDNISL